MADTLPILQYKSPSKSSITIDKTESGVSISIPPTPIWVALVAWFFAAFTVALVSLFVLDAMGEISHVLYLAVNRSLAFSDLVKPALVLVLLLFLVGLLIQIIRRHRIPTHISVGQGRLTIVTPELPQLERSFGIDGQLTVAAVKRGVAVNLQRVGELHVLQDGRRLLVLLHGKKMRDLLPIEQAIREALH
jgi:hypothetical protein